jgi:hypothetical protein
MGQGNCSRYPLDRGDFDGSPDDVKRKFLTLPGLDSDSSVNQPVASRYGSSAQYAAKLNDVIN